MNSIWNIHGEEIYLNVDLNTAIVGDNTLIAADPANELMVQAMLITTQVATTLIIKLGATTVGTFQLGALGSLNLSDIVGMTGEPILKLAKNNALVLNNSAAANRVSGMIKYALKG